MYKRQNQPFVVETPKTLKIRSGCDGGGKGALIQENKSATLGCNNDQTVFVPFVKGTRPHSPDEGQQWRAADVANTLNTYDVGEARCNDCLLYTSLPRRIRQTGNATSEAVHLLWHHQRRVRLSAGYHGQPPVLALSLIHI